MSELTQERLAELRRVAETATDAIERALFNNNPDAVRSAERGLHVLLDTLVTQAAEIERLRRVVDAAERLMIALDIAIDAEDADDTFVAALDDIAAQEIIELRAALSSASDYGRSVPSPTCGKRRDGNGHQGS